MPADRVAAFVRLSRPHFLVGGALLFGVGAAAADTINAAGYALAQLMVTAAQLTAHYANEYADANADRLIENRTWFSGGSGVLAEGLLPPSTALRAAAVSTAVSLCAAIALMAHSVPAALIGVLAVAVSWSYSMPPLRLLGSGFGEITATLIVAGAVPVVGSLAQGSTPTSALWWSVAILIPLHFAMMLSFELPDLEADEAAGKRVLLVRIGRRHGGRLLLLAVAAALAVTVAAALSGGLPGEAMWAITAGLLPAALMASQLHRSNYALLTAAGVATLAAVALGLIAVLHV